MTLITPQARLSISKGRSDMREKTRYRTKAGTWGALLIVAAMFYSPPVLAQTGVPKYEVDPFWPKHPNNWAVGQLGGTCVDTRDHVFLLHWQRQFRQGVLPTRAQFQGRQHRDQAPYLQECDSQLYLCHH